MLATESEAASLRARLHHRDVTQRFGCFTQALIVGLETIVPATERVGEPGLVFLS